MRYRNYKTILRKEIEHNATLILFSLYCLLIDFYAMNINPDVIRAVQNLHRNEVDPQRRRYVNLTMTALNEREALFVVRFLYGLHSQETSISTATTSMGESQQQQQKTTGLILAYHSMFGVVSVAAVTVFLWLFSEYNHFIGSPFVRFPTGPISSAFGGAAHNHICK
jgi:hypothetical protein